MKKFITLIGLTVSVALAAATVEILPPANNANGILTDVDNDGVIDEATTSGADGMETNVGKIWGKTNKAVFEFQLPENLGKVKSAKLRLYPNGSEGCYPEVAGGNGPECWVFYYLAPEANGKIELSDDSGEKLQIRIPDKALAKPIKPIELNVTPALEAAQEAKSRWVGLRVEISAKESNPDKAWRFRTLKFGEKYDKISAPALIVETE